MRFRGCFLEISLCGATYFARVGKVSKPPLGAATHDCIVLSAPPPDPFVFYGGRFGFVSADLVGAGKRQECAFFF